MKTISFSEISNLKITPQECILWATNAIKNKNLYKLPPKTSIKFGENNFFNTMPSLIPELNMFGLKMVSRITDRTPALKADILLYDLKTGELLALLDGTWITSWRTGAVAAITINALSNKLNNSAYAFIGLGNTARTTLLCLEEINNHSEMNINLLAYKDQHDNFIERFKNYKNLHFTVYNDIHKMIQESNTIISCITATNTNLADETDFQKGTLVVPVHTRGFQNCELQFDKIYCDDIPHISGFQNFSKYKTVIEMTDVLNNQSFHRNKDDRIIAYNIGISIHDIYYASQIFNKINSKESLIDEKFWV